MWQHLFEFRTTAAENWGWSVLLWYELEHISPNDLKNHATKNCKDNVLNGKILLLLLLVSQSQHRYRIPHLKQNSALKVTLGDLCLLINKEIRLEAAQKCLEEWMVCAEAQVWRETEIEKNMMPRLVFSNSETLHHFKEMVCRICWTPTYAVDNAEIYC